MELLKLHRTFGRKSASEIRMLNGVGLWWLGGTHQNLSNPSSLYFNGSTYITGYEDNVTYNQAWIIKQTGLDQIDYNSVGDGTVAVGMESNNHPAPMLVIDNLGYIFVIQNAFHVYPFRVWKSNNPEDISSFTELANFGSQLSYLGLVRQENSNCWFISRKGGAGDYSHVVVNVNLVNPALYTQTQICDSDASGNNVRHYPLMPKRYGSSDYYVGGIAHRLDSPITYYKNSIWITQDFDTFENIEQTFSKTISVSGPITIAELEANFAYVGTDSDRTNQRGEGRIIHIDNDIFHLCVKEDESTYQLRKYTIGVGFVGSFDFNLPWFYGGNTSGIQGIMVSYIYYIGGNIIITSAFNDGISNEVRFYTISKNLTNFSYKYTVPFTIGNGVLYAFYTSLPDNVDEVGVNLVYPIIGRCHHDDTRGKIPYVLTSDKFIN